VVEKIPLFALAAAASAVTYLVQRDAGAVLSLDTLPVTFRIGNAMVGYAWYVRQTVWPS
jgi:hypothetical protein